MPQLLIKIKDKIAKPLNNCVICDNSDYTVKFIFDEEWEKEPLRIARFIWNKQYVDVQFTGDTCEVPVVSKTNNLAIGVYAGDLRTTTPAILVCHMSILSEDVIEHSVTPSEYEEIMKLLNAQATDIAALKAVDKSIWTNLDTINKTASAAKIKAEEGVAKADDALTATRTNTTNINSLTTDVNALKATDERIWTNLDTINKTASTAKIKAEEGVAKADEALARNIFTDEEKAKLANITNPIIIKGRVDTVNDLPTEAVIGWFYFVGLESASSYEEYCYSENGWEYIGLSQEGVDLSNYYTKKQVDTTVNELKAIDNSLGTRIDNVDSKASAAKVKAEEGVAKADDALTKANSNTTDINSLNTDVTALKATDTSLSKRIDNVDSKASTAKTKAEEGVAKADNALAATRTNATNINAHGTRLDSIDNTLSSHDTKITTVQQKANSVDEKVDATNDVVANIANSLQTAFNKINAHTNNIALNRTTLGYQRKNLFKNTVVTQTAYGVTFTVNDDKSITVNGTATQTIYFNIGEYYFEDNKQYILNGCPSGGSETKYFLAYDGMPGHQYDTGSGTTFSISESVTKPMLLVIKSGQTVSNLTFKPMLRYADITDDTYEPYKESVDERLIKNKSDIAVNKSTLGYSKKNLFDWKVSNKAENFYTTVTSETDTTISMSSKTKWSRISYKLPTVEINKSYILSVKISDLDESGGNSTRLILSSDLSGNNVINAVSLENNGVYELEFNVQGNEESIYLLLCLNWSGTNFTDSSNSFTASEIMLRYADITDDTYEPYQPSLQEQTAYSLSISGKSTSAAISYSGVPTLICLTPNTADSTTGGLYMINSAGAVIKLIEKTGIVVAANTANNTFTITNNTITVMDVCISRCWGR